jgi:hypothetical protein
MIKNISYKLFLLFLIASSYYSFGQSLTIEGAVIDSKNKKALAFATIGIKGTTIGTAANAEGRFILSIPEVYKDSVLFCSYMGYKNFEIKIIDLKKKINIELELDTFTLDEIEIRPWEAWDYVWNAMQKIPENYPQNPYITFGYYSEYISENGVFLKYTEGITETYNPSYDSDQKIHSKVLKARRGDELGTLKFMREKLEKKYEKEKKKAEKKGEEWEEKESIDEEILSASFGGPEGILSTDPLRDTAAFLDINLKKKYKYFIDGYSRYFGEQVIIIGFETKGKYEHQRQEGSIYISMDSNAIIAIEYDIEFVIPAIARPVILLVGFGITNPQIHVMVHYKPVGDRWYVNDISMEGGTRLTKKKMFKKNDRSNFFVEMALINTKFELDDVHEIPEEERIDKDKPLEEQVDPDPEFWDTYKVVRPSQLSKGKN